MGVCFGSPNFPTPSYAGHPKSGAKWKITTSSSSAASNSHNLSAARTTSSSPAASNSHDLLAARDKRAFGDRKIVADPSLTVFSFAELKEATKNFPAEALLGEGGFGRVYKGMLHGKQQSGSKETIIAVKILKPAGAQGYRQWRVRTKSSSIPFSEYKYFALSITKMKQPKCMMELMGACCHAQLSWVDKHPRENSSGRITGQHEFI
ncbi:probable serine/threonine-protein kinase PIX13 [Eucalyptus grandis]|uniref:probable serine/threonine-protein kinase PIX13 n=1 Tax=Eucalyptus grandis TaxID=71139 RepID=UPI00192EA616|nr:probable serine/threonine-protein kinase PIX13 [Eucalyptus grandis]